MHSGDIGRSRLRDLTVAAALIVTVALIWCLNHNRIKPANWQVPLAAASDSLTTLVAEKSAADGNYFPVLQKFQPHFGAPYVANWNDYPTTEEPLIAVGGLLTLAMGLFAASNLLVLLAHIFAGLSFYFAARAMGGRWPWTFVGGLVFALSPYAFFHGFGHLALTYYWHIPLCLLISFWCGETRGLALSDRPRLWAGLAIGFVTGVQNPYYTNLFVQFLGFAVLAQLFRRQWKKTLAPLLIGATTMAGFFLMNLDTLTYQAQHGKNAAASGRSYQAVEVYALKPLDMFIPPPEHRSAFARQLGRDYLYDDERKVFLRGEMFGSYLGLIGMGALLWLGGFSLRRVCRSPREPIPVSALLVGWVIVYSVVGGFNGFLGQLGITFFRCTSRYSIYILAIVLIFGVRELSRLSRRWHPAVALALAGGIAVLALWDQLPKREGQGRIDQMRAQLASDRAFTQKLEDALPSQAMVFQLPPAKYPESWPIVQMGDYEHFRPYLFSHDLRFSYGDIKGRGRDDWQFELGKLPVAEMLALLERVGFSALYINRRGYSDGGVGLIKKIEATKNYNVIESPAGDLVSVLLQPSAQPELPARPPEFRTGWYDQEGADPSETWHFSKGNSEIILHNDTPGRQRVLVRFELSSPSPRTVEVWGGEMELYRSPTLGSQRVTVELPLMLAPGANRLSFKTEPAVVFPGNPDTRQLGFMLWNFTVSDELDTR